jgi:hypothetical protein
LLSIMWVTVYGGSCDEGLAEVYSFGYWVMGYFLGGKWWIKKTEHLPIYLDVLVLRGLCYGALEFEKRSLVRRNFDFFLVLFFFPVKLNWRCSMQHADGFLLGKQLLS